MTTMHEVCVGLLRDLRQLQMLLTINVALTALTLGVLVDRVWR